MDGEKWPEGWWISAVCLAHRASRQEPREPHQGVRIAEAERLGAASSAADRIHFTGFLENDDLAEAYRGAAAYVFPSLFEGFGLSLLEAMAAGVSCACSNNGSLGELAADVAETFEPNEPSDIAAAISRLLDEPPVARARRHARGIEYAATFTWRRHAEGLVQCLKRQCDHPPVSRLFRIPISKITQAEFTERLVHWAKGDRAQPKLVATVNVDFVTNAVSACGFRGNDELWGYLQRADLVTADGMPIVLLSRLKGQSLPGRVTGSDMVPALAERFAEEGLRF